MKILVIKLGALGDFVLAFPSFAAIRAHHQQADITLLTTAPFASLGRAAPWFDRVEIDPRPPWWHLAGLWRLRQALHGFDFVYDLQTSGRSSRYFHLAGRPAWSGIARGASHPHANAARNAMHTLDRQRDQLEAAGLATFPAPDLSWLTGQGPDIPAPYALLAPGSAPHRPEKRWPAERFAALASRLHAQHVRPVVIGAAQDRPLAEIIRAHCAEALDLTGRTSLPELAGLAARAALAIGNDTGPMHLAAALGCRSIVLFSGASDPALTAPRGPDPATVIILREPNLADLPLERVAACLAERHECHPLSHSAESS